MTHADKKPLVIIGNGEIALMAFEYFTHDSDFRPVGFSIGKEYLTSDTLEGLPVVPLDELESRFPPSEVTAFVAIGDPQLNRIRARHYKLIKQKGYRLASYVSSRSFVWHNVEIGENCFILEDNTLQPFVKIGNDVILWSGNHVGHRSIIHDHAFLSSHVVISGFCSVGEYSFIGVNVAVANGVNIAADNFIVMGSGITADTEADRIYQVAPAEPRKISAKRFCRVKDEA